eukprot:2093108-Amphidinium_carterae.1
MAVFKSEIVGQWPSDLRATLYLQLPKDGARNAGEASYRSATPSLQALECCLQERHPTIAPAVQVPWRVPAPWMKPLTWLSRLSRGMLLALSKQRSFLTVLFVTNVCRSIS